MRAARNIIRCNLDKDLKAISLQIDEAEKENTRCGRFGDGEP